MKILFLTLLLLYQLPAWAKIDYNKIDQYAYEAPVLKDAHKLSQLVRHLVRPYKTDEEKARVILAWIVHNIDYDEYKLNALTDSLDRTKKRNKELVITQNDILETRMGVCEDIATLYQQMGNLAGLDVVLIRGKTKDENTTFAEFENSVDHVWNAVKIDREWEYVDPTWAIGGQQINQLGDVEKKREYEKIIRQRERRNSDVKQPREGRIVNNEWFLTNKDDMIKTHFPFNEKWQLQKKKITIEEFLNFADKKEYQKAHRELRMKRKEKIK